MGCRLMMLLLLRSAGPLGDRSGSQRHSERGFSMAMAMLVLLAVILGTAAIASRTASGLLGVSFQSRNREARDVAEAGIAEIISEFNKEDNRRLLVSGKAPGTWTQADAGLVNPCTRFDAAGNVVASRTPTARAIALRSGFQDLVTGNNTRQFALVDLQYTNQTRAPFPTASTPDAQLFGTDKSLMRITVEGRVRDAAGNVISTSRVTREFEVVPKCCKRSFGMNRFGATTFGTDQRNCFFENTGANGIVVSLNGGTLDTSNNEFKFKDENGSPLTRALCRSGQGNSQCDSGSLKIGSTISVVPTAFSFTVPAYPGTIATWGNYDATAKRYIGVSGGGSVPAGTVQSCNLSGTTLSSCTSLASRCEVVSGQYYCRFSSIDSKNTEMVVDSSNGILNFYFDDPAATSSTEYLIVGGNGTISHNYCSTPPALNTACSTGANLQQSERLNFFATGPGQFDVRGGGTAVGLNIYAPNASVTWRGGGNGDPNFLGRIWTNNLDLKGGISLQTFNSNPTFCTSGNCPPPAGSPDVDWVARSITYSSSF